MPDSQREPLNATLEALLTDPLTRLVMAADGIGLEEMRELLQAAWIATQARTCVPLEATPPAQSIDSTERFGR